MIARALRLSQNKLLRSLQAKGIQTIRKLTTVLGILFIVSTGSVIMMDPLLAADEAIADAFMLLNVESDGVLSARDLVFTNKDTGAEVWVRDLLNLGRAGSPKFIMERLPAGEYYLSSIYPTININDNATRIELDEGDGLITILPGTINYIGDFIFKSRERGRGVRSSVDYEPNTTTLLAALAANTESFRQMDVVVSIAGNAPVPVDKRLLGL